MAKQSSTKRTPQNRKKSTQKVTTPERPLLTPHQIAEVANQIVGDGAAAELFLLLVDELERADPMDHADPASR